MQARRTRWRAAWAALAVIALAGPAAAAPPPIVVEAIRIGLGGPGQGRAGQFKVGTWTPVRVQLTAGAEPFEGFLDLTVPDDDGTPTVVRRAVRVGANATEWVTAYTRPGSVRAEFEVQMRDARGRRQGAAFNSRSLPQEPGSLWADQLLLATLGRPLGVDGISRLGGFGDENTAGRGPLVVAAPIEVPDGLPARPYGYDAAEAVVLDTNDKGVLAALDAGRGEPLKAWVRNGGHLVVAVGSNWQQVRDSILGPMLPAVPEGRAQLDDLGALESFAGSTRPITKVGGPPVTVTRLEQVEARGGKALDSSATPLVVRGPYGFGRVTLVALDVDQKPFSDWEDRPLFWAKALDLRRQTDEAGAAGPGMAGRTLYQSNVSDLSTMLRSALEQFDEVRLVPFGWVAFFIFLYILLIGPGDYLFLKKVVKRMELTWITFPLIVLTVSLVAYYAAYAVKGTDLRINKVDALDVDQQSGLMRGSTWLTIFSPQNRDYDLSLAPRPIDLAPGAAAPAPASRRSADGSETLMTWFGMPETVFGGMNNSGRLGFSSGAYQYGPASPDGPPDRPESLRGVRVPIWSTKSFIGRWSGPAVRVLDAELEDVSGRLFGTLTNRLNRPLINPIVAYRNVVYYNLGTIPPDGSVRVELKDNRNLSGYLDDLASRFRVDGSRPAGANLSRADLVRVAMFHDGGGPKATSMASNPLGYLDLSGQLALDRPMLVAELADDPAVVLDLGDNRTRPKTQQTTVLRVILPLGKSGAEAGDGAAAETPQQPK